MIVRKSSRTVQSKVSGRKRKGFSFIEIMVSMTILVSMFIFMLPFFVTARASNTKEGMAITATETAQGVIDRLKALAHAQDPGDEDGNGSLNDFYYDTLSDIYNATSPQYSTATSNAYWLDGTPFRQDTSYISVHDIDTAASFDDPSRIAKKVEIYLEWDETVQGQMQRRHYRAVSYIGQPASSFSRNPGYSAPAAGGISTVCTSIGYTTTSGTTLKTTTLGTTTNGTTTAGTTTAGTTLRTTTAGTTTQATTTRATTTRATTTVARTTLRTTTAGTTTSGTTLRTTLQTTTGATTTAGTTLRTTTGATTTVGQTTTAGTTTVRQTTLRTTTVVNTGQ